MDNFKNNLTTILDNISNIYTVANESYLFSKYFNSGKNDSEIRIIESPSIRFLKHSMWRICIIELDKVFKKSDNHHFSFYEITNIVKQANLKTYHTNLDNNSLFLKWVKDLSKAKSTVTEINKLRNKLYAHTDRNKTALIEEINLDYSKIEELLEICLLLIKEMNLILLDRAYLENRIYFRNPKIVESLANHSATTRKQLKN
ncbi:hypothetical protein [Chryseobacterium caseinilyticum]|uniref:HEPN AbiU2-like domain-containing protein n=1 Tax=Chryseobacterium caseinilyticum TaxID=2771428 RepID=A0ABR8ZA27_9FLAO|nr:hypothetical protein [Chryseobacterium caseinilyticum]MBD8082159.1 hypothetical protein [Chryseobacterium caseinilyticum]